MRHVCITQDRHRPDGALGNQALIFLEVLHENAAMIKNKQSVQFKANPDHARQITGIGQLEYNVELDDDMRPTSSDDEMHEPRCAQQTTPST